MNDTLSVRLPDRPDVLTMANCRADAFNSPGISITIESKAMYGADSMAPSQETTDAHLITEPPRSDKALCCTSSGLQSHLHL
jgi:hypothetical protein